LSAKRTIGDCPIKQSTGLKKALVVGFGLVSGATFMTAVLTYPSSSVDAKIESCVSKVGVNPKTNPILFTILPILGLVVARINIQTSYRILKTSTNTCSLAWNSCNLAISSILLSACATLLVFNCPLIWKAHGSFYFETPVLGSRRDSARDPSKNVIIEEVEDTQNMEPEQQELRSR